MAKKVESKKARQKQGNANTTIIIIIAAFVVVVVGMIILTQYKPVGDIIVPTAVARPQTSGLSMGDPNAPVKVVEFADYQCPACANYALGLEPTIVQNYVATGQVYYTVSPFNFLGEESFHAGEAAYCANDQGKFWEYRDILLANYNGENGGAYNDKRLIAFAGKIGLDSKTFEECFASKKYEQKVLDDNTYAKSQGVTGTPSFLVNGTVIHADTLIETINAAVSAGK